MEKLHDEHNQDDDLMTPEEQAAYYREVIKDAAQERLDDYALRALWALQASPFLDVCEELFDWPYAGSKSQFSLLEELLWVIKQDRWEGRSSAFRNALNGQALRLLAGISDAEERLLFVFLFETEIPEGATVTYPDQQKMVVDQIVERALNHAENYDRGTLSDAIATLNSEI